MAHKRKAFPGAKAAKLRQRARHRIDQRARHRIDQRARHRIDQRARHRIDYLTERVFWQVHPMKSWNDCRKVAAKLMP